MYRIRIVPLILLMMLLCAGCGASKKETARIAAYRDATARVQEANSSEELLEISYSLHLELLELNGVDDATEHRSVVKARNEYEASLKSKEMELYAARHSRK